MWEQRWARCLAGLGAPGREPRGGFGGFFAPVFYRLCSAHHMPIENPAQPLHASTNSLLHNTERGFPLPSGHPGPPVRPPPAVALPLSPKEQRGSKGAVLLSRPEQEWFPLAPQWCVQSLQLLMHSGGFSLCSAGSQPAASSPQSFTGKGTHGQVPMWLWGHTAKLSGSAVGASGISRRLLRATGSYSSGYPGKVQIWAGNSAFKALVLCQG